MPKVKLHNLGFNRDGQLVGQIHSDVLDPRGEKLHTIPINPAKLFAAMEMLGMGHGSKGWIPAHQVVGLNFKFEDLSDGENPLEG